MQLLIPILKDVASFLKYSPDEIIILDFHRFPVGFKSAVIHRQLLEVIQDELGDFIIERPLIQGKLTLREIWETNKRIIISYSEDNMVRGKFKVTALKKLMILIINHTFQRLPGCGKASPKNGATNNLLKS